MEQARQVLTACEKAPADAVRINYDPRNPFDIDSINFLPIYKGSKHSEDPYTSESSVPFGRPEFALPRYLGLSALRWPGLGAGGLEARVVAAQAARRWWWWFVLLRRGAVQPRVRRADQPAGRLCAHRRRRVGAAHLARAVAVKGGAAAPRAATTVHGSQVRHLRLQGRGRCCVWGALTAWLSSARLLCGAGSGPDGWLVLHAGRDTDRGRGHWLCGS